MLALPEAERSRFRDLLEEAVPCLGPPPDDDDEYDDEPMTGEPAKEEQP